MVKGKRGDPDDLPKFKLTSFCVPPQVNSKNMNSNYLRTESQTVWSRKSTGTEKRKRDEQRTEINEAVAETLAGSKTIVIHPGSQTLRIGLATDYQPLQIPMVIARRRKPSSNPVPEVSSSSTNGKGKEKTSEPTAEAMDVDPDEQDIDAQLKAPDTLESRIANLRQTHLKRTHALKLRPIPQGRSLVQNYNSDALEEGGEKIEDFNDPLRVEWWDPSTAKAKSTKTVVGEEVGRIPPESADWVIRRPFKGRAFNLEAYEKLQVLLDDLELFFNEVLEKEMRISKKEYDSYSVILVIPDHVSKSYIREMSHLLLATMGFKQMCVQQESLGATFGAGISAACVVDIGATRTSIACVEDGAVVNDSKMCLNYGGDDITRFLSTLLVSSFFPYQELDLGKSYDFKLIEGLKEKICTLNEAQVGVNLNEFVSRRPGKPTMKYRFKVFDEVILAPMGLFEPRAMERESEPPVVESEDLGGDEVDDLCGEWTLDLPTVAMISATQHLRPPPPPIDILPTILPTTATAEPSPMATPTPTPAPTPTLEPVAAETLPPPALFTETSVSESLLPVEAAELATTALAVEVPPAATIVVDPPTEPITKEATPVPSPPPFDVLGAAARIALDFGIVHSIGSAGGEDKVKKFAGNVLVIGGGARSANLGWGLESRLHPLIVSRFPSLTQSATQPVQIIAPPREIDPRFLIWKGTAVFGRLESIQEFWVGRAEWEMFGMRALREKSLVI
ncbi:Actin-related protein [Phaffia rhodozyma]|uniref:Actin-related protein n=1 Tax=Phaffia rhodozyma TaxID=264483 RepID=A0A0F7SQT8_PHARH|nr:Actin-related protein [Phaffia rhodozyma]